MTDLRVVATDPEERARQIAAVMDKLRYPAGAWDDAGKPTKPPRRTALNLATILAYDPFFAGRLAYNEFSGVVEWEGQPVRDTDVLELRLAIAGTYEQEWGRDTANECVDLQARRASYHPVRDYLDGLVWDGTPRLESWLSRHCGAEDTPITRAVGARWMMSAVARVRQPGVKVDTVLVLVGGQGAKKSSAFEALAGAQWFADTAIDLRSKDAYLALEGVWVLEFAELASLAPSSVESAKAFMSSRIDNFRAPYGRRNTRVPRQCVFGATTNLTAFLTDPTGGGGAGDRRYWPVMVRGVADLDGIRADRDQLWAEADERQAGGEQHWLTYEEEGWLREAQQEHRHEDPWAEPVAEWLLGKEGVTLAEILASALEIPAGRQRRGDAMRLAAIMQAGGWVKRQVRTGRARSMRWYSPGHTSG